MRTLPLHIKTLCEIAHVSTSGYYKWLLSANKPENDHNDFLLIAKHFNKGKGRYGIRTIKMRLLSEGVVMNVKKIGRIKRKYGLFTRIRRKNPYKMIMKASLDHRTCENKLQRKFTQTVPFTVLSTDITYIPINHRFVYLSAIKDIASREIVAWSLGRHLEMSLVLETLDRLHGHPFLKTQTLQQTMIHSDQGFHYTNPYYIEKVKELHMTQSMSRKGNCIDNAPIESFFGHLKDDLDYKHCTSFEELHSRIEKYMQYYNHERRQWNLQKMTPVEYRNHLFAAK